MDRSEDERRPAQRAGDQSESEGSRAVSQPNASVIGEKRERRLAGPQPAPERMGLRFVVDLTVWGWSH